MSTEAGPRGSRWVGPAIAAAGATVVVVLIVTAGLVREDVVRPELGDVPIPEGAVVRYADERCPTPEPTLVPPVGTPGPPPDGPTVCDAVLAITPMEGLWLPGTTEEALVEHLAEAGWTGDPVAPGAWLKSPDGQLLVRVEGIGDLRSRSPGLAGEVEEGMRHVREPERLAVLTVLPGSRP